MLQIRPGDLIAVRNDELYVLVAILSKQVLFGGHWCFVMHHARDTLPAAESEGAIGPGFNAAVDFIVPRREGRVIRISRDNDFSSLNGPELLQQAPLKGEKNYRIWRWKDNRREDAEYVRFTPSPTREEQHSPHYCCLAADFAWKLAARAWTADQPMWNVTDSGPAMA